MNNSKTQHIFQRTNSFGVLFWFLHRNFFRLFSRLFFAGLFVWLMCFGGIHKCLNAFFWFFKRFQKNKVANKESIENVNVKSSEDSPKVDTSEKANSPGLGQKNPLRIMLISDSSFVMADGLRYGVGDNVGRLGKVEKINFEGRCVSLSGGVVLRMREFGFVADDSFTRPSKDSKNASSH